MIFIKPIQDTNHCTAKTSQSSGFLVFPQDWAYRLLDFPELIPSWSYQTAIEEIAADRVPYLVYPYSYRAEDPT